MATPRYTRETELQTGIAARNAGAPGMALAQELEQFTSQRDAELDRRAAEEGQLAGLEAGQRGELGPDNPRSIRDRAFQEGALVAHQAALQTDIRNNVGRFVIEAPDDPDAFDAKVTGLSEGLLK
ncbi:MAG TPA: hypothetical protein VM756_00150, partial [Burkholderiales bacterium]|nr:hypothetical protein [Burkholderiales bacterium]